MESKRAAAIDCDAQLTVYPDTLPVPDVDNLCVEIYGQLRARSVTHPDPFSFRGIREYSPHDPLKAINFKASAKAQELMVNLWEHVNARQVILLYNLQRHSIWHNDVVDEYGIKLVASLATRLTKENVPLRFITNGISVTQDNDAPPITEIPEGIGELQLERVLETLALLDVTKTDVVPFADILTSTAERHKTEPEYWLVSTYHGKDLEAVYKNLTAQGARAVWVLPHTVGLRTDASDINVSSEIKGQVILI